MTASGSQEHILGSSARSSSPSSSSSSSRTKPGQADKPPPQDKTEHSPRWMLPLGAGSGTSSPTNEGQSADETAPQEERQRRAQGRRAKGGSSVGEQSQSPSRSSGTLEDTLSCSSSAAYTEPAGGEQAASFYHYFHDHQPEAPLSDAQDKHHKSPGSPEAASSPPDHMRPLHELQLDRKSAGGWPASAETKQEEQRLALRGGRLGKSGKMGDTTTTTKRGHLRTGNQLRNSLILALFLIGLIICLTSLVCLLLLPTFISQQISRKLVLKNNSMLLERWSKPNVPMFFKVWMYNVKNAQELIGKRGVKPQLEEVGPFVFNLRRQKDVISFAGDNLYYTERKIYKFNRELSCCAINTSVTIPNIPLVAVVDRALSYNLPLVGRFIPRLINRAIQTLREPMFVRKQVGEILFDGYDVELLRMVSRIGSLVGLPQQSQRFAILKGRNDTWRPEQDGVWAINTGQRERHLFGRVSSWNSYRKLPFWPAPQCNVINGSDGTLFPPPIKRSEPLYIFNQELCRTVNLVFDRPSDIRSIQAYRFVLNPLNFAHTVAPPGGLGTQSSAPQRHTHAHAHAHSQATPLAPLAPLVPLAPLGPPPGSSSATSPQIQPHKELQPKLLHQTAVQPEGAPSNGRPAGGSSAATARMPPSARAQQQTADPMRAAASSNQRRAPNDSPTGPATVLGGGGGGRGEVAPPPLHRLAPLQVSNLMHTSEQEKLVREVQLNEQRLSPVNPHTCFCDRKSTNLNGVNVCEFDGLIDLSKCSKQAQVIFGSMPHFFNSDPRLQRQVVGMQPNASKHTTYLDIEPNTGLVLGGKRRVQLNLIVKRNNEIDGFENINDMLLPIVWFEESAQIPEEAARKFKSLYTDRVRLINLVLMSIFLASVALLAVDLRLMLGTRYWRRLKLAGKGSNSLPVDCGAVASDGSSSSFAAGGKLQAAGLGWTADQALIQRQGAHSGGQTSSDWDEEEEEEEDGRWRAAKSGGLATKFENQRAHNQRRQSSAGLLTGETVQEDARQDLSSDGKAAPQDEWKQLDGQQQVTRIEIKQAPR